MAKELLVSVEEIVFPEMVCEPGAARGPDAVVGVIDGGGAAPEVEVVVDDPAGSAVVKVGDAGARLGEVFEGSEERGVAFGKVGDLGGPVVHFRIDVDGVLAVPGGSERVVPDALEVGGLAAGAAGGDEQIAPVLKEKGDQGGVFCAGEVADAFAGGEAV